MPLQFFLLFFINLGDLKHQDVARNLRLWSKFQEILEECKHKDGHPKPSQFWMDEYPKRTTPLGIFGMFH